MTGGLSAVLRLGCRRAVPDDTARDAVLDKRHALLRRPFEVECLRQSPWIERVVGDRDLLIEYLLAEAPREVAALFEQPECTERVMREVVEEVGERVRLENSAIYPGFDLRSAPGPSCFLCGLLRDECGIDPACAPGGLLGVAGSVFVGRDDERGGVGHALLHGQSGGRRDGEV